MDTGSLACVAELSGGQAGGSALFQNLASVLSVQSLMVQMAISNGGN